MSSSVSPPAVRVLYNGRVSFESNACLHALTLIVVRFHVVQVEGWLVGAVMYSTSSYSRQ